MIYSAEEARTKWGQHNDGRLIALCGLLLEHTHLQAQTQCCRVVGNIVLDHRAGPVPFLDHAYAALTEIHIHLIQLQIAGDAWMLGYPSGYRPSYSHCLSIPTTKMKPRYKLQRQQLGLCSISLSTRVSSPSKLESSTG